MGLCVTQFDPKLLERGLVCSVGALPTIEGKTLLVLLFNFNCLCQGGIISVEKVPYFKSEVKTKAKFHSESLVVVLDDAIDRVSCAFSFDWSRHGHGQSLVFLGAFRLSNRRVFIGASIRISR